MCLGAHARRSNRENRGDRAVCGQYIGYTRDAGLIACGQGVEHYEMARYGALIAWAEGGSHKDIVDLLQQTLDEEKKADKLLRGPRSQADQ